MTHPRWLVIGSEEALLLDLSSLSLAMESGIYALLVEVRPFHVLESDALEPLCILSLTSGTKSLPWIASGRRAHSRLGEETGRWTGLRKVR